MKTVDVLHIGICLPQITALHSSDREDRAIIRIPVDGLTTCRTVKEDLLTVAYPLLSTRWSLVRGAIEIPISGWGMPSWANKHIEAAVNKHFEGVQLDQPFCDELDVLDSDDAWLDAPEAVFVITYVE
jgi:hypothetical protein